MADTERLTVPAVVELPAQIDATNAEEVCGPLRAALDGCTVVVADMAKTTFCDSRGTQELLNAHYWAQACNCELRVARPSGEVLRTWMLLGADRIFVLYPTLPTATDSA